MRLLVHGLSREEEFSGTLLTELGMQHIVKRASKKDHDEPLLYPISERVKDEDIPIIQEEIKTHWKNRFPEDDLEKAINTIPDIIKVSKLLGDVIHKHWTKHNKGLTAYDAFIDFINHPTPGRLVKALADNPQEALESIYKLHVKLYHTLPEFFEKESGIDHLIPQNRREKIREEALRELGLIKEEQQKIRQPVQKSPVAVFEDRALAEEFATLKGGKVIQTPEGKYAVMLEGETAQPTQRRHWVEEVLGVPPEQIKKHPETGYEYIEKDGKIIILPHDDPRKLGLKGPDEPWPKLQNEIKGTIKHKDRPIEQMRETARVFATLEKEIRSGKIRNFEDFARRVKELKEEYKQKGLQYPLHILSRMEAYVEHQKEYEPDVRVEHLAAEFRYPAIMLNDAAKLTEDAMKNPEKYGIDPKLPEVFKKIKIAEAVFQRIHKKYVAFHKR